MRLRVLLADDHMLVRQGIESLLRQDSEIEVVGEADSGRAAIALARQTRPDVVIMDSVMPDMNGTEATRQIIKENAEVKVLAVSMYDSQASISGMLEAGATGYVLKTSAFDELADAIRIVQGGEYYLCRNITAVIVKDYLEKLQTGTGGPPVSQVLTAREREVLKKISEGTSTKEIARLLGVSPKTVDSHRMHIMSKLKITSVAGLTRYALREGLTSMGS
jgi:DNA-binding NarL/FixJ family response regulator